MFIGIHTKPIGSWYDYIRVIEEYEYYKTRISYGLWFTSATYLFEAILTIEVEGGIRFITRSHFL